MANNTTDLNCGKFYTPLVTAVLVAVDCFMAMSSLFGNIIVVVIVCRKKELKTSVNYFIASMAVSDLLVPLIILPLHVRDLVSEGAPSMGGPLGDFFCRFLPYALEVSIAVSILTMVTIAAERFHCVLYPLRVSLVSNKARRRVIALIWIASIALQSYYLDQRELDSQNVCVSRWELQRLKIQHIVIFVFQIAVPFTLLVLLSTAITFTLYSNKQSYTLTTRQAKRRTSRNRKISLMLAVIIVVFLAAWTPYWIRVVLFFFDDGEVDCSLKLVLEPLYLSYTAANPLVYYIFNEKYRKAFKELMCYFCQRKLKGSRLTSASASVVHNMQETRL